MGFEDLRRTRNIWLDTPQRYGLVSRAFHWGMAYLLIWQFVSLLTWRLFGPADWVTTFTSFGPYHGTVGLLTIILVVLRACWALVSRKTRPLKLNGWQGRAAWASHCVFYLLMFTVPALAMLRSYGNGKGWTSWGVEIIPATGEEVTWMMAPANALHGVLAWVISALIVLHIVAALFHKLVRRDAIMARMTGSLKDA